MRRTIMNMVAIASLLLMSSFLSAEAQQPDATLKMHTTSIAAGIGIRWGEGIVAFQGKEYPCRVNGLSVGEVGISSVDAIGNVYNLTTIEDFSGDYTAISAGVALAGGGDVATMRNQNGVVIDLTGTSLGAKIMLAVQGMTIALAGAPTASQGQ